MALAKPDPPEEALCPMWMMTFGDCMSLLVTFFVMLIAFTNTETDSLLEVLGGMKGALGVVPEVGSRFRRPENQDASRIAGPSAKPKWLSVDDLSAIIPDAQMTAKRFGRPKVGATERHVFVRMLDEGLAFIISAEFLFEKGNDLLLHENDEMLLQLGRYTREFANEVRIIGVVPESVTVNMKDIRTPSGLGIARAISIMNAFQKLSEYGHERFGIGSKMAENNIVDRLPPERIEIIIVGRRELKEITPEEIVVQDKWF
jgi:chemotaxis protein MotB